MKIRSRKTRIILRSVLVAVLVILVAFGIYVSDYYRADAAAADAMEIGGKSIGGCDNLTVFSTEDDFDTAMIFYPGGKVEHTAYAPLLALLAQKGIACILVEMPFNLAVFDINAADKALAAFPDVKNFYLAGHSLGGAMASSHMAKNSDAFKGLLLLGAYPVNDAAIPTLAIYGSLETGWDRDKLKDSTIRFEIEGGNHAQFGNYGPQKGDAMAAIPREEQQDLTVERILAFISETR